MIDKNRINRFDDVIQYEEMRREIFDFYLNKGDFRQDSDDTPERKSSQEPSLMVLINV